MRKTVPLLLTFGFMVLVMIAANSGSSNVGAAPKHLSEVLHDTTLSGDGSTESPLGIATAGVRESQLGQGAVTSSKIADGAVNTSHLGRDAVGNNELANGAVSVQKLSAGVPSTGQFLGFNGAGLTWQMPSGGVKIVDNIGQLVALSTPMGFLSQIEGMWVLLHVNASGFACCSGIRFWYESTDCTGQGYQPAGGSNALASIESGSVGDIRYFPSLTDGALRTLTSAKSFGPTGDEGECQREVRTQNVEVPLVVDVSSFGLVPPFRLSQ